MIPKIPFGRTGHLSSRIVFGAAALGRVTQDEANRALDLCLEYGINHIDTAANYGESELRIGAWLPTYRKQFFLATKTQDRGYAEAKASIHRSLDRLRTDQIDLIQLHYLVDPGEWLQAMGPGGALEACIEAREQGLVRFIGVTGHEIPIAERHLQSLARFDFDSVLLPYNYALMQNPAYAEPFERLLALCATRNVAVQTIKALSKGRYAEDEPRTHAVWYPPLTEQPHIDMAVHWVLGRPGIFLNSTGDVTLFPKVLDAAARFEHRPTDDEMAAFARETDLKPMFV